ncbi:hypothetical protein NDU88_006701 [Pleurodeles waltl]|uniref:Uncharacterized protein n=1 Tax=Pleurodeles waltl TaxID=8319 RepID=A0AAV7PJ50_PLEWA|nr:hypothetical protein NDU88_006701 [Pleurodeles waltl]
MSAQPLSIVQKQQSNMNELCNEDQEKENSFDYGLDTSFKPDEWCNVENILLRKRTRSRNMTVTIYRVPSRTNNVPQKSPTGILHANESLDLPYGLAAQCYKAWNRRQKQKATRRNSTIMVYLESSMKNRVLHYTPTENVLVKEAIDFPYNSAFLATQDSKNFELHSDTRGNKLETEPTISVEGADFQDIHNDGMIDPCEENEDEDTPGCFNLGNFFRNMRKYFQKKYTRL